MIRRRLWISLVGIVTVAVVLLAFNLATDNEPVLGLDLQGGVSVVLSAESGSTGDDLIVIRDLIRDELETRGIAEPDVRVEGENIVVDLPGVRDQREALEAADVAGIVSLRPVVSPCRPPDEATASTVTDTTEAGAATEPSESTVADDSDGAAGFRRPASGDTEPEPSGPPTTESSVSTEPPATSEPTTTTTEPPLGPLGTNPFTTYPPTPYGPPPPPPEDSVIELRSRDDNTCVVGPVQRGPEGDTGGLVFGRGSARALIDPNTAGWMVTVGLTADGRSTFNNLALQCFQQDPDTCPTGQLAIVLDDVVQSAPVVQQANFEDTVQITGNFTEGDARSLARVLNRGAFPVDVHTESVQTVSPTLGEDSLRAALFAGLAGIALVLVMLAFFYRRLVTIVVAGLAVWGLLIYSAAAIISQATNFALTLAGATGIIVAIGITVDSYVVYFERLKEEVRHGRTMRNSAARSFRATWRTILAADFVGLTAAVVLFSLSVGAVRGFALYLGVTTVCDLIVCFFFTRPAVGLLAGSGWLDRGDAFGLKEYQYQGAVEP